MAGYYKCLNCKFNVTVQDVRCPNCGLLQPTESLEHDSARVVVVSVVAVAVVLVSVLISGADMGAGGVIFCGLPVGAFLAFLLSGAAKAIYDKVNRGGAARRRASHVQSLTYKERLINQRVDEIQKRAGQISAVRERAKLNSGERWEQVCSTLDASLQTLQRQRARYNAKAIEIEMVRLQNRLAPLIHAADDISYEQIDARLKAIEDEQKSVKPLDAKLNEQRRVLGSAPDVEELSQRLSGIEDSMRKLHEAFVGRQAVLSLRGISPLDDALVTVSPPVAAIRESEVFNTQVALTDFSASFDELESEYMRLQTEEDVAGRVSEIIGRAEGGS